MSSSFAERTKKECWKKADVLLGRNPDRWRKDAAGNVLCGRLRGCVGCLCHEYDHIIPVAKGGEPTLDNCQILQTKVNRSKSDKEGLDASHLQGFSCDVKFTDKELDVIEMAVYGDVIRQDKRCRCKTVDEVLGKAKSKKPILDACELPYQHSSVTENQGADS